MTEDNDDNAPLLDALDQMYEGFTLWSEDLHLVAWNKTVPELLGWPEELARKGNHISQLLAFNAAQGDYGEGDRDKLVRQRLSMLAEHQRRTCLKQRPGVGDIELNHFPLNNGSLAISYRDVTQRKQAKDIESRLGLIVEQSLSEVYIFDANTFNFILVNHGARSNLGYTMEEMRTMTPLSFKPEHTLASFEDLIEPLVNQSQKKIVFETVHERKNGSTYDAEVHLQLMAEEDPPVYFANIQDITDRKDNEVLLSQAKQVAEQANRAKSEFLANMSHELRTPLNAVIGLSEIMSDESLEAIGNERYREYVAMINGSGVHLLNLINDILDLSKIDAEQEDLDEETLDIPQIARSVLNLLLSGDSAKPTEITIDISDDLPPLYADERKLKQILLNLLSNARKFSDENGKVTLKIRCSVVGGHVFQIIDHGIGIAAEDLAKALSQFGQVQSHLSRKYKGTGLGLPLSKSLVEMHGGTLDLKSEPGVGTTVAVQFPPERVVSNRSADNKAPQSV